jgi:insulysin
MLSMLQFRFSEKQRPDSYATWITERMGWPVPRDSVISAAKLMEPWGDDPLPRRKVKKYLESFRIDQGRAVLMAKAEEHANLTPGAVWSKEQWYNTDYRVERFDEEFIKLV